MADSSHLNGHARGLPLQSAALRYMGRASHSVRNQAQGQDGEGSAAGRLLRLAAGQPHMQVDAMLPVVPGQLGQGELAGGQAAHESVGPGAEGVGQGLALEVAQGLVGRYLPRRTGPEGLSLHGPPLEVRFDEILEEHIDSLRTCGLVILLRLNPPAQSAANGLHPLGKGAETPAGQPVDQGGQGVEQVLRLPAGLPEGLDPGLQEAGIQQPPAGQLGHRGGLGRGPGGGQLGRRQQVGLDLAGHAPAGGFQQSLHTGGPILDLLSEGGNLLPPGGRVDDRLGEIGAVQHPGQGVVVAGGDGVELVVVAAGAGHRQAQEGLGEHVDLVVDLVGPGLDRVDGSVEAFAQPEKTGADRRFPVDPVRPQTLFRQQVSGHVLANEAVIGNVLVEGPNDGVAVAPDIGLGVVELVTVGFGKADQVQPMASPALAVVGRGQQAVDHLPVVLRGLIGLVPFDVARRGRQAGQAIGDPAKPTPLVGGPGRLQPLGLQPGEHESVDGRGDPAAVVHRRQRGILDGPERPEPAARFPIDAPAGAGRSRPGRGKGGSRLHPPDQVGDLPIAQPAGWRHLELGVLEGNGPDQQALLRLAGRHRRAAAPPRQHGFGRIQPQPSHGTGGFPTMAGMAAFDQQRPDPLLEELGLDGVRGAQPQRRRKDDQPGGDIEPMERHAEGSPWEWALASPRLSGASCIVYPSPCTGSRLLLGRLPAA